MSSWQSDQVWKFEELSWCKVSITVEYVLYAYGRKSIS